MSNFVAFKRWSKVKTEGDPDHFLARDTMSEQSTIEPEQEGVELLTLKGNE